MIEILNRWTSVVQYRSEKAETIAQAATEIGANLSGAGLIGAGLIGANLIGAGLSGANLIGAGLIGANLSRANLSRANLSGANLSGADLSRANLSRADLSGANLSRAGLIGANLSGADLSGASLPYGWIVMQVLGSIDAIVAICAPDGVELRIGCEHHPLTHWQEHYRAIGRINGYTPEQVEEYGRHLAYIAEWAAHVNVGKKGVTA